MDKECPTPELLSDKIGSIVFLSVLFFLTFISRYVFAPLMPAIEESLGISHTQAGSIFLMVALGNFTGAMSAGVLSSKINHKGNLVLSTFLVGVVMWVFMFVSSLTAMRVCVFVLAAAAGLNLPSNVATITAMVSREDWGKALGIQQVAAPLSLVVGPIFAVFFLKYFDWQMPLAVLGTIAIVASILFAKNSSSGEFLGESPSPSMIRTLMGYKSFWIMVVLFALCMGGQVGVYAMLPLYLISEQGMDADLANTLLGLSQVSCLFLMFFSGWFTDRLGEKRMIFLAMAVAGLATLMLGIATGGWLKVLVFLQPALIVCYFPAGYSALSRCVQPNMRGLASSIVPPTASLIGGGLLPALLGYMGENYSFSLGITIFGGLIFIGSGLVFSLTLLEKMDPGC